MEAFNLRTVLSELLSEDLGFYITSSGKTYPAIRITPPKVDPSWKVSGLEVTILLSPEATEIKPVTSEKLKMQWWVINLVQFDESKSVQPAIDKIEKYFIKTITRVKGQTITDYEQARITIYDPVWLGVSRQLAQQA